MSAAITVIPQRGSTRPQRSVGGSKILKGSRVHGYFHKPDMTSLHDGRTELEVAARDAKRAGLRESMCDGEPE